MYDPHPDSIQKDLAARDEFGSADFIGIIMDPYQEGVNGIEFLSPQVVSKRKQKHIRIAIMVKILPGMLFG